jgi:serine protease Do
MMASKRRLWADRQGRFRLGLLALIGACLLGPATNEAFGQRQRQRLSATQLKSGAALRSAFREVVANAREATVRVRSDGKNAAFGAIVDPEGFILTKASQLDGELVCRLRDGRELPAKLIGISKAHDLAMLKIPADSPLPVVTWSDGVEPSVGQWLATPGLDDLPVAIGVMSVQFRSIPRQPGVLGIGMADDQQGSRIVQVYPNSAAADAGLKVGDIIRDVAGDTIDNSATLAKVIGKFDPGDTVTLRILRDEEELEVEARLGHSLAILMAPDRPEDRMVGNVSLRRAGFPTVLQHDTVLKPEDCGGPLVNLSGDVVGINIARAGRTESYAIPTSQVLPLLKDLKSGRLPPANLVQVTTEESETADELEVPVP